MKCDLARALDVLFPTYKRRGFIGVEAQAYETICRCLSVKPLSDFGFDGHAAQADAPAIQPQRAREAALEAAALDFVAKVERGEARSERSYQAFKRALSITRPECGSGE